MDTCIVCERVCAGVCVGQQATSSQCTRRKHTNHLALLPPPPTHTHSVFPWTPTIYQIKNPQVRVGVCAMDRKAGSKPMREIINRLMAYGDFDVVTFGDEVRARVRKK